ncbi:MAG TPA: nodulation protein NfeD [Thermoanaerobaculia bacterium]|nr:nodulation protein NfeD [Thermoanaerobaculia bacterium]
MIRRVHLLLLVFILSAASAGADVLKIVVDDMIHPISAEFIARAIDEAARARDEVLLIELRTPGGLETSTREIVNRILESPVPVIIYVSPSGSRAASAGFFILQAADVAAMAPGTNTGAAHPVILGEEVDDVMMAKMENDSAALMRTIATRRGRNVEVAESAVRESKSFTEDEALAQNLIDLVARNQQELLQKIEGRKITRFNGDLAVLEVAGQPIRVMEMTVRQKVFSFLMDPNVAFLLFSIGMLALWAEFNNPGAILPGVIGVLCIVLALFALNILPTRYAALALIILAFGLFALEAMFTSHGVFGAGGVIAMFIGGLLLVDGPIPEMRVHWITALAVSLPFGIIAVFLMTLVLRSHRRKITTGEAGMIGELGVAESALDPMGKVFVHGELWSARSPVSVERGRQVVVRAISGLELEVEPVGPATAED